MAEDAHATEDPDVTRIRAALLDGVPADPSARNGEQQAKALLADLIDWHRREAKPAWWRYFYVRTLSPADLIGEPDALGGLTGGGIVAEVKQVSGAAFLLPTAGPPVLRWADRVRSGHRPGLDGVGAWTTSTGRST